MRIAYLADPYSPNAWYRAIGPLTALSQRGHEVRQVIGLGDAYRPHFVHGSDLLLIHRQHDERALAAIETAKRSGTVIVWDNDDDMTAIPRGNVHHRDYGGLSGQRVLHAIRRIVAQAHLVTTPSARLAQRFADAGARRVEVVENYVRDELSHVRRRGGDRDDGVTIGWLAGREHHLDVERLPIAAALQRLVDERADARVVSIGIGLGLSGPRYRHVPGLPFVDLGAEMVQFDVGIAPLADIAFNQARSNIKLKEYAVLGVPWLASPVGAYVDLGEREGGYLVQDDGWFEALDRLVGRRRERRKLAKRAAKWGRAQTVSANVGRWEDLFAEALERAATS